MRRLPLMACLFVFALSPAFAMFTQFPSAVQILRRCLKAHRELGPVTIRFSIATAEKGKTLPLIIRGVERRNDPRHRVTEAQMVMRGEALTTVHQFVNGGHQITYDVTTNEYRTEVSDDSESEVLAMISEYIARRDRTAREVLYPGEKRVIRPIPPVQPAPRRRPAKPRRGVRVVPNVPPEPYIENDYMRDLMDRTPVERFEFRGEPVSRLTIRPTLMPDRMPGRRVQALTLLIGKDDLIRKRTMWFQGGRAVSVTYSYDQMHIPFPEEVFVFTPPDGVVEAAGKKDSRIIP